MINRIIFLTVLIIFNTTSLAEQWKIKNRVEAQFPIKALKNNQTGCVNLQFFINSKGIPVYIEILKSSTGDVFDKSAITALSQWTYQPTELNPENLPERKTLKLSFALASDSTINDDCYAEISAESNDMSTFREDRLSMPILANNRENWQKSLNKINTILSASEQQQFKDSYNSLEVKEDDDINNTFINNINGLNYFQIMLLAENIEKESSKIIKKKSNVDLANIPITPLEHFFYLWDISDMAISMEPKLYDEISHRLLKIEILVNADGTAKLLSTCRSVSDKMKKSLNRTINKWEITARVKNPKMTKFIYGVPSPSDDGAFYQCNDNWHPENNLAPPRVKISD
jgi:TonB family protein